MSKQLLNINKTPVFDNSISKYEFHAYSPYNDSFGNNDTIIISIQQQNLCVLPSESYLYIEGIVTKAENAEIARLSLLNNGPSFLFEEIRYELNGVEIDRTRKVGSTTTIKNYISLNVNESMMLENAGWKLDGVIAAKARFNFCIPLKNLLGFAEDYKRVILNAKHDLILTRSKTNKNLYITPTDEEAEAFQLKLNKIQWRVPHVNLADDQKIMLYKDINKHNWVNLWFRSWDMHEYPTLPQTTHHIWTVKTSSQLEKPRFVILALQTNRLDTASKDASKFDHCHLNNVKVHLNSDVYPYESLNINFSENRIAVLYHMYLGFQKSYYGHENSPLLSWSNFQSMAPIAVIDCSHQDETVKSGPVDIKVEFETSENIPANTTAYCLLIHDRVIEYNMFTNEVKKIM